MVAREPEDETWEARARPGLAVDLGEEVQGPGAVGEPAGSEPSELAGWALEPS